MKLDYRKIIYSKLKKAGKKPLTFKELLRSCRGKGFEFEKFTKAVDKMKKNGEIMEDKFGTSLQVLFRTSSPITRISLSAIYCSPFTDPVTRTEPLKIYSSD